jgi:ABC-type uncharacterized transport system substrate-binding protein
MAATKTIPIVMATAGDPIALGYVSSLARPGGNVTGFSLISNELNLKRLDLLRTTFPLAWGITLFLNPLNATAVAGTQAITETGMAYGPNVPDNFRRAAGYVDRILKGANPGDLPIQQPAKFDFVINMRAARLLGVTLPQTILSSADEIIE